MKEQYENEKEQELIQRAEKETFQEANGFSEEENEYIRWKHQS